jgi:hypothetical protein
MNRDIFPRRLNLKILSEYRDINSRIFFALSNFQIVEDVEDNRNKNNDNNNDKESSSSVRQSISIISLIFCEKERANMDKVNQNQIRYKYASDFLRADKNSELKKYLIINKEKQNGVNNINQNDKNRNNVNYR